MEEKITFFFMLSCVCLCCQHPPPNVAPLIIQLQHHQSCQGKGNDLQATDIKTSNQQSSKRNSKIIWKYFASGERSDSIKSSYLDSYQLHY